MSALRFSDDVCYAPQANAQMEKLLLDLGQVYRERKEALLEVTLAHHNALLRLAQAAEYRDDDTAVHMVRMGFIAEALALALGQPVRWAAMLRMAAPMHDIGKIGIPDHVLKKPGKFTPQEREVMDRHAAIGAEIIGRSSIPLFQLAAEVALTHHEKWNGSGYPARLAGDQIPLAGRIVAVVDFFDALTMDRCYRKAFSDEEAMQMLKAERGLAFDPHVVEVFLAQVDTFIDIRRRVNADRPSFADLVARDMPCAP
jgi:putative two-component system response regulator